MLALTLLRSPFYHSSDVVKYSNSFKLVPFESLGILFPIHYRNCD